jgi:hypothetical protein
MAAGAKRLGEDISDGYKVSCREALRNCFANLQVDMAAFG